MSPISIATQSSEKAANLNLRNLFGRLQKMAARPLSLWNQLGFPSGTRHGSEKQPNIKITFAHVLHCQVLNPGTVIHVEL